MASDPKPVERVLFVFGERAWQLLPAWAPMHNVLLQHAAA
jgi:hypothetical protein